MKAQIIIIGDELLNGSIQDKNISPLAKWLDQMGFACDQVTITKDREDLLLPVLKEAWEKSDLVITTGGLGPTEDDITKQILAKLIGSTLAPSDKAQQLVEKLYSRRDKKWNPELNHYHLIPKGVEVFDNPKGFAPGLMIKEDNRLLLATPGVPRELIAMLEETLPDIIKESFPNMDNGPKVITFRTHGIPEEKIFGELCPGLWQELSHYGKVSSLPQVIGVDIHILLKPEFRKDYQKTKETIVDLVQTKALKDYIWSNEFITLEEAVIKKASEKNLKIGFSESCTGGLVAHKITNISGSSRVFMGSLITYSNEAKKDLLGVSEEVLKTKGAVSEETALEMVQGTKEKLKVDVALSLTGIAGPLGGSKEKPVGTVCIGEAFGNSSESKQYQFFGDRALLKERFAQTALLKALKIIEKL
ncbi:MAG: hypothetical protein CME60_06070 [Halobacteriovoraceae bacterium]|nr:hypothetical protein [Halobacteriovoraceae bacterium]